MDARSIVDSCGFDYRPNKEWFAGGWLVRGSPRLQREVVVAECVRGLSAGHIKLETLWTSGLCSMSITAGSVIARTRFWLDFMVDYAICLILDFRDLAWRMSKES